MKTYSGGGEVGKRGARVLGFGRAVSGVLSKLAATGRGLLELAGVVESPASPGPRAVPVVSIVKLGEFSGGRSLLVSALDEDEAALAAEAARVLRSQGNEVFCLGLLPPSSSGPAAAEQASTSAGGLASATDGLFLMRRELAKKLLPASSPAWELEDAFDRAGAAAALALAFAPLSPKDLRALSNGGARACFLAAAEGRGKGSARDAADEALQSPLLSPDELRLGSGTCLALVSGREMTIGDLADIESSLLEAAGRGRYLIKRALAPELGESSFAAVGVFGPAAEAGRPVFPTEDEELLRTPAVTRRRTASASGLL